MSIHEMMQEEDKNYGREGQPCGKIMEHIHHQSYSLSTDADLDTLGEATNADTEDEDDAHTSAATVRNLVIVELVEGDQRRYRLIWY